MMNMTKKSQRTTHVHLYSEPTEREMGLLAGEIVPTLPSLISEFVFGFNGSNFCNSTAVNEAAKLALDAVEPNNSDT